MSLYIQRTIQTIQATQIRQLNSYCYPLWQVVAYFQSAFDNVYVGSVAAL